MGNKKYGGKRPFPEINLAAVVADAPGRKNILFKMKTIIIQHFFVKSYECV